MYCVQEPSPNLNTFNCLLIYPSGVPNTRFNVRFFFDYQGQAASLALTIDPLLFASSARSASQVTSRRPNWFICRCAALCVYNKYYIKALWSSCSTAMGLRAMSSRLRGTIEQGRRWFARGSFARCGGRRPTPMEEKLIKESGSIDRYMRSIVILPTSRGISWRLIGSNRWRRACRSR